MKWYEEAGKDSAYIAACRIRLVRNLQAYRFPHMLGEEERTALTKEIMSKLGRISALDGRSYDFCLMEELDTVNRNALAERKLLGKTAALEPKGCGFGVSKDEAVSFTINSVDHLRMQISRSGMELTELWHQIDRMDDCINESYPYAYHDQFGYLAAYPTNLGTGMKAYLILHLALLETVDKFPDIINEIGRYGLNLKPAFGKTRESSGGMYVLFNQKTLGVSEQEILQVMENIAGQLMEQEKNLRTHSKENHRIHAEDICCKAYGHLRYSRMMSLDTGMRLLSQLRWGQEEEVISFDKYTNIYDLMMAIQPANLCMKIGKNIDPAQLDQVRAEYLRKVLPVLKES